MPSVEKKNLKSFNLVSFSHFQITFCVGLCFVIGVVCSFGLFRAFIYHNELFYMGVLNFVWYMYYLFFVLFFIAVGSKITREVS